MHLLTYSFHGFGDIHTLHHMACTDDPISWLVRKRKENKSVCIVWMHELSPSEKRRLDELKAAGVEVEK
jgi:hypothetical protein